jgi:outer membrane protein OmpA-like peptidoglycan-associated protein
MIRPATTRTLHGLFLLLGLAGAPTLAHAQPVEDPGLSEPPKPPPPATPPPTTLPPPRTQPPMVAVPPLQPPETHETVDTQVKWIDGGEAAVQAEGDMYERVVAPSLTGPVGLFRTLTGESGRTNTFRVGLHLGGFSQDNFLIAGNGAVKGDHNNRFVGDLIINYTPWKYIEAYLGIYNASNQNQRTDPGRTDPEVILALGDLGLGLKGRYDVARFMDLALNVGLRFLNSVSGISFDGSSTNVAIDAIASWDLRHAEATKNVPLRFHLNFGFLVDNSLNLLPVGQCGRSTSNDPCIRSRVVETFAYGIGTDRLRISAAADLPFDIKHVVGLQPFIEWHVDASVGSGDTTIYNALKNDRTITSDRLNNIAQQWLTLGVRVRPVAGLVLDTGLDVGLQSPGFVYGPPVPAWQLVVGASYAVDPHASRARTKLVTKTITREVVRGGATGRVRGVVRDAATKKVLAGVTVKYLNRMENPQLTGDDGTFLSYRFSPGPVMMEVSRDDYEAKRVDTAVRENGEMPLEVLLTAKPPSGGQLRGKLSDEKGMPVAGTVRLTNSATSAVIDADFDAPGSFSAKLPAGDYTMEALANGFLAKRRNIAITPGGTENVDVVLTKKPAATHVTVAKTELRVKGTVHFGTNNAELEPDGEQLLDEVADVLSHHPEIKRLRIEGHTDNRGDPDKNMMLSKARAAAVVGYLVKQGIDPARLDSEGFGATQPLVPNLTPANRARNRRVAFKILERSDAPPSP